MEILFIHMLHNTDIHLLRYIPHLRNHPFSFYRTALHIACANGHVDVVQFLVESKAKLNLCDNQNRSPLMKVILDDKIPRQRLTLSQKKLFSNGSQCACMSY